MDYAFAIDISKSTLPAIGRRVRNQYPIVLKRRSSPSFAGSSRRRGRSMSSRPKPNIAGPAATANTAHRPHKIGRLASLGSKTAGQAPDGLSGLDPDL